ncbi:sigma-E factor negative regulatory protein [Haliea sp. E17]|uniref:sigma-E factor negative regulatory protein n=1 Tax=Haliea sp. E17 TaxID=3401576 RepID=UPI003AAE537D
MSERLRESLSAMLDDEANELETRRLIRALDEDPELLETWRRYQVARGSLAGNHFLHMDISSRVRDALEAPGVRRAESFGQKLRRPLASFAVAASVAATVVIGGQQLAGINAEDPYGEEAASTGGVSPVGLINSIGAVPVRASYGTESVAAPILQPSARTAYEELARQRMQIYMQEHAEHAALNSPQGLIPFARVPEIHE